MKMASAPQKSEKKKQGSGQRCGRTFRHTGDHHRRAARGEVDVAQPRWWPVPAQRAAGGPPSATPPRMATPHGLPAGRRHKTGPVPCRLWRRRPACWGWPLPTMSKVKREKRTIVVSAFEFDAEFGSGFHPSRAHVSHWTRDGGGFERRSNPFASFVIGSGQFIGEPNPGSLKGIP